MGILYSHNPCDGSMVWSGQETAIDLIPSMVQASRNAFAEWSMRPLAQRESVLSKFAALVAERTQEIATLISREIGKPFWESKTEAASIIGKVAISITAHKERCGEFTGGKAITRFRPHGVVAVIGPYNFPGHLPNGHICPALLAGNTVLFKPSELAPATGAYLVQCWKDAGLPVDVLQLVQGGPGVARALTAQDDLDGIFFTGSAATGKILSRQLAGSPGKILTLEMGGNNPLIVDTGNIGDLDSAAGITLKSAFISTGQRCTCARRLILIESANSRKFLDSLVMKTMAIVIGDPFADPQPFIGPLASAEFPALVCDRQNALVDAGAEPVMLLKQLKDGTGFVSPGILDVTGIEKLPDEEIFAPLLQLIRVKDLNEAIVVANDTRYGLASGILTDNKAHYDYAYARLRSGIINWNTPLTGASSGAPFGGIRDSGNNRPSAFFAADYCSYPVASIESETCEQQD